MRLDFLALPSDERRLDIEQAAVRRNLSPVILEKDFWIRWLRGLLFECIRRRTFRGLAR